RPEYRTALRNNTPKQAFRKRRDHELTCVDRACGLAEQGDIVWIAAELGDISLNPSKRSELIQQTIIAGAVARRFRRQLRVTKKSEDTQPIIQGHQDHAT